MAMSPLVPLFQAQRALCRCGADLLTDRPASGTDWVRQGIGIVTVRWQGYGCCLTPAGVLRRVRVPLRVAVTGPRRRTTLVAADRVPADFVPTGHPTPHPAPPTPDRARFAKRYQVGWVPLATTGAAPLWDAPVRALGLHPPLGTYELVGPGVRGNHHRLAVRQLQRHCVPLAARPPTNYHDLVSWFVLHPTIYGLVWWQVADDYHAPRVSVTRSQLGLAWP